MFARASAVIVAFVVMVLLFSPAGMGQQKKRDKGDKGAGDPKGGNQWANRGGGGGKKGGGQPGGGFDVNAFFEKSAKDGFVVIAEARGKEEMEKFAKDKGITNGKLNKEQFAEYMDQRMKSFTGGKQVGPGAIKTAENKPAEKSRADLDKLAQEEFKKRDSNGDGKLNYDEMDAQLRREMVHYDKNQDQLIDLQEFTAYFIDRYQEAERAKSQAGSVAGVQVYEDDLDVRPVVFRYGKLPRDLPEWFTSFDTNQDGLVSLAEWLNSKSGKSPEEFAAMDRDGDGLLTPEEVLRFQNGGAAPSEDQQLVGGGSPGFGNRGFGGGNKGGFFGAILGGGGKGGQQGQFGQGGFKGKGGKGGGGGRFGPKTD